MRLACLLSLSLVTLLANAGPLARNPEVEIELRYHPDKTGQRTTNRSIAAEGTEGEISEDGDSRDVDVTRAEFDRLREMVRARVADFPWSGEDQEDVEAPYVEMQFKYEARNREIEVELRVPAGSVPKDVVALQEKYFENAYR